MTVRGSGRPERRWVDELVEHLAEREVILSRYDHEGTGHEDAAATKVLQDLLGRDVTAPTLRELRATLSLLYMEVDNVGAKSQIGQLCSRAYDHMVWLLDAYLFDVDDSADDGGRE